MQEQSPCIHVNHDTSQKSPILEKKSTEENVL